LTPVPCGLPAATTPSCVAGLRSMRPHATDSLLACASAPNDADATAAAACPDWPRPEPRSAENDPPSSAAATTAHPADRSFACAPAWCGSRPHPRSTTQTASHAANARTSASVRWIPSPHAPSDLALAACDRTATVDKSPFHSEHLNECYRLWVLKKSLNGTPFHLRACVAGFLIFVRLSCG